MHPAKKAIKIIQSWKMVGQLGECRTKGNWSGGHSRRTSTVPFVGLFGVFIFFLAKDTLKTQMWESQRQVCSIANYYEFPLSSISERPFVLWLSQSCLSKIGVEMPQTVAWLFLWQDVFSAQIKMANIFREPSGVQALQCASKCFSPSRMPLQQKLVWLSG